LLVGSQSPTYKSKRSVGIAAFPHGSYLSDNFGGRLDLVTPNRARMAAYIADSDVVIGAVHVPGAKAPKLVSRAMVASVRPGSVVVDIAINQGGCIETSRPTTHADPTYIEEGVVHYCVANIPGAVARTSTLALTSATLPYLVKVAGRGIWGAAGTDPALPLGLSTLGGHLVNEPVAQAPALPKPSRLANSHQLSGARTGKARPTRPVSTGLHITTGWLRPKD